MTKLEGSGSESKRLRGPMSPRRLDEFLNSTPLCRISCLDGRGWPYVVPVWFDWDGSKIRIVALSNAAWVAFIEVDSRVGFVIDQVGPVQRVVGQGWATISEHDTNSDNWLQVARRISDRYLGTSGREHVETIRKQPMCLIDVVPERLLTWFERS